MGRPTGLRGKTALRHMLAALALVGLGLAPAAAQRDPKSILPPGFDDPAPPAEATPTPGEQAPAEATEAPARPAPTASGPPPAVAESVPLPPVEAPAPVDLPPGQVRQVQQVGLLSPAGGGFAVDAFGSADGRFLQSLTDRIDVPLASRWVNIALRRALVSQTQAPAEIDPVDWVASRALLLARLGHADDARALTAGVDLPNYTPRMEEAALQAALATADPAALCGMADRVAERTPQASWELARGVCAGLATESATASSVLDRVRRSGRAGGIDVRLAEKVAAAGGNARRAINIQWTGVEQLNAWRYGMAAAVAVPIPRELFLTVGPQVQAWFARAPLYSASLRLPAAERAAALGVFSNAALVDLYGWAFDELDSEEREGTPAALLQQAYVGASASRLDALGRLWGPSSPQRYGRYVLTARAAARIPANQELSAEQIDQLVAAMFSAGLDIQGARWRELVAADSLAAALLAVGAPQASAGSAATFGTGRVAQIYLAARAGLGRGETGTLAEQGVDIARRDSWVAAIERAVAQRQPATVVLLTAVGMQTPSWQGVPPAYLYHMVASLRAVGLEPEARMIAAEALTRL